MVATFRARRNKVMKRSRVGKPLKSAGLRKYRMTSKVSSESAMLVARRQSSRTGGTGRISKRTVPKSPTMSQTSPNFSSRRRL